MYEFIKGTVIELNPAYLVLENNGTGFFINISLNTYSKLDGQKECMIYIHQVVREDALLLFGFYEKREREVFKHLISVSGIGANTARMILSSLTPEEVINVISQSNVNALKNVKGIGIKTAQRVIIDLKDKLSGKADDGEIFSGEYNTIKEESLSALVTLGFQKKMIEKVLEKIFKADGGKKYAVEEVIKMALKQL